MIGAAVIKRILTEENPAVPIGRQGKVIRAEGSDLVDGYDWSLANEVCRRTKVIVGFSVWAACRSSRRHEIPAYRSNASRAPSEMELLAEQALSSLPPRIGTKRRQSMTCGRRIGLEPPVRPMAELCAVESPATTLEHVAIVVLII